jgi:hypothetical protein
MRNELRREYGNRKKFAMFIEMIFNIPFSSSPLLSPLLLSSSLSAVAANGAKADPLLLL